MESTFKRMNLGYVSTPEQDDARIALATKLLNDSIVKAKLKETIELSPGYSVPRLTSEEVIKNPYKVQRWLDSLQPCIGCKGLEFCKQEDKGHVMNLRCDVFLQLTKAPCKFMMKKLKEEEHLQYYVYSDLPKTLTNVTFRSINLDEELEKGNTLYVSTYNELQEMCSNEESAYIYGPFGTGKTYLAACACNYFARKKEKVAFVHWPSFVTKMPAYISSGECDQIVERLKHVHFLVIDEIGGEAVTQWNRDQLLLPVLNARYEANLPTWFTSNCDYKGLEEHFKVSGKFIEDSMKSQRIMERIRVMTKSKTLTGKDRRESID